MRLYSNVIWANWEGKVLTNGNVIIVGNSLMAYDERTIDGRERDDPSNCVFQILPFVRESAVSWKNTKNNKKGKGGHGDILAHVEHAFNDLSVTHFLSQRSNGSESEEEWPPRPAEHFGKVQPQSGNNIACNISLASDGEVI